jgi:transcription antitermination factor NusG
MAEQKETDNYLLRVRIPRELVEVAKREGKRRGMALSSFVRYCLLKELDRTQRF